MTDRVFVRMHCDLGVARRSRGEEHKRRILAAGRSIRALEGIWAVKEIIEADSSAHIVMTSSVGTQQNLKEALKAGARDFIQKPLDNEQIKHVVETKLKGGN